VALKKFPKFIRVIIVLAFFPILVLVLLPILEVTNSLISADMTWFEKVIKVFQAANMVNKGQTMVKTVVIA
jgi:hypothetical protein